MNATTQIPATQNDTWGFYGTMNEQAEAAWPLAMTAISDATSQPLESVRAFLDSRHGRHPALDVLDDWPQHQPAIRHPQGHGLPHRLRDPLRNHGTERRRVLGGLSHDPHGARLAL